MSPLVVLAAIAVFLLYTAGVALVGAYVAVFMDRPPRRHRKGNRAEVAGLIRARQPQTNARPEPDQRPVPQSYRPRPQPPRHLRKQDGSLRVAVDLGVVERAMGDAFDKGNASTAVIPKVPADAAQTIPRVQPQGSDATAVIAAVPGAGK